MGAADLLGDHYIPVPCQTRRGHHPQETPQHGHTCYRRGLPMSPLEPQLWDGLRKGACTWMGVTGAACQARTWGWGVWAPDSASSAAGKP